MNTKQMLIASAAVVAVLSCAVPAQAQLLGGNAGGGLGGALSAGHGAFGGAGQATMGGSIVSGKRAVERKPASSTMASSSPRTS